MKRIFLTIAFILAASFGSGMQTIAAVKGWENVKMDIRYTKPVVKDAEFEIRTAPTLIVVVTSQPIRIKVFTILGRLISDETLQTGTSRLAMDSPGVYIIKAGELTCKVAI